MQRQTKWLGKMSRGRLVTNLLLRHKAIKSIGQYWKIKRKKISHRNLKRFIKLQLPINDLTYIREIKTPNNNLIFLLSCILLPYSVSDLCVTGGLGYTSNDPCCAEGDANSNACIETIHGVGQLSIIGSFAWFLNGFYAVSIIKVWPTWS